MTAFHFVVIGAGAAGAACAWRLCEKGFKVLLLERGDWPNPDNYPTTKTNWELEAKKEFSPVIAKRQNDADYPVNDTESPIALCNYNGVGGSTILYSGHFPRFLARDFSINSLDGVGTDWPVKYDELTEYFDLNEKMMSVSGLVGDPFYPEITSLLPPVPIGIAGELLAKGFNQKNWHWWPSYAAISTRNTNGRNACINLGPCNLGCPQGAKSSVDITYITKAQQLGLVVRANTAVTKILTKGKKITGVKVADNEGNEEIILSERVILASGAIGTPRLLLHSASEIYPNGLANSSDQVGKNLMLHPLGYAEGMFDHTLDTHVGPQGCLLYSLEHHRVDNENIHLGYMMQALRGTGPLHAAMSAKKRRELKFGKTIFRDFEKYFRKQLGIAVVCEDLPHPNNRITLDTHHLDRFSVPGVKLEYKLTENSKRLLSHGLTRAREVLKLAGAKKLIAHGPVRETGWHIMGTARMGNEPSNSVVTKNGFCHDVEGLYIVDASIFVSSSCVNPANTIQSLALYLTDKIAQQYNS